jgi:hypothetical protein
MARRRRGPGLGKVFEGQTCGKFGKMTAGKRHRLPDVAFGLPDERKYPMPDPAHAKNAKARAQAQYDKGNLTKTELKKIDRKADRVISACNGGNVRGLGVAKHWTAAQAREYQREVRACIARKRCSTRRGKKNMYCTRGCKSAASRTVGA